MIPLGFTLNTLLYGGVVLGLVETFAFARRRARRNKAAAPRAATTAAGSR